MNKNKVVRLSRSDLLKLYDTCLHANILCLFVMIVIFLLFSFENSKYYLLPWIPVFVYDVVVAVKQKRELKQQGGF